MMVREFEEAFARRMGVEHALAVTSGTAALRVALSTLDLEPTDEVITQSFTFVATAEARVRMTPRRASSAPTRLACAACCWRKSPYERCTLHAVNARPSTVIGSCRNR